MGIQGTPAVTVPQPNEPTQYTSPANDSMQIRVKRLGSPESRMFNIDPTITGFDLKLKISRLWSEPPLGYFELVHDSSRGATMIKDDVLITDLGIEVDCTVHMILRCKWRGKTGG